MIIPLSDTLRVRSTELNWQLERFREYTRKGQPTADWQAFSYHGSLSSALREAAERDIRATPCEGLAEAIAAFRRATQRYHDILDRALEELGERAA